MRTAVLADKYTGTKGPTAHGRALSPALLINHAADEAPRRTTLTLRGNGTPPTGPPFDGAFANGFAFAHWDNHSNVINNVQAVLQ